MPDNTFTIGAIVNVEQFRAGFEEAGNITQAALDKMVVTMEETSSGTQRAMSKISADTEAAALTVSADWKVLAAATLQYRSALKEVTGATYLARAAGEDDAAALALLAAAKQKAAAASVELAAAEKGVASSAEVESLSMEGLAGSMGGLVSSLLGVGIGAGMFAHTANEAADFALQMRNLGLVTGISAYSLAGLHDVVKEMGGDFDSVSVGLSKMLKAQQDAVDGQKKQIEGFHMMGISVNELKTLSPEELLYRVAQGFQNSGSSAEKNAAAIDIFGRGGRALIPIFESVGGALRQYVEEEAKVANLTPDNIAAPLKWKEETEELSVAMRGFALDVLPGLIKAMAGLAAGAVAIGASIETTFIQIRDFFLSSIQEVSGFGKILKDVATGNFGAIELDARATNDKVTDIWTSGARDVQFAWRAVGEEYNKIAGKSEVPQVPKVPGGDDHPGDDEDNLVTQRLAATKRGSAERVAILQEEVNHLQSIHAQKTGEFERRETELNAAIQAYTEQQGKDAVELERRKVEATRKGSEERIAIERELLATVAAAHGEKSSEYTAQENKVTEAVRAAAEERVKLEDLDIEQARITGVSKIQLERQNVQAEFDLHRINAQQRIALLKQIEDEEYEITKAAIEKKLALEKGKGVDSSPVETQRIQNQIENLTREHNNRLAALNTEGLKESQRKFDQFFSHVTSGFQTAMNGWLQGTQTFSRAMQGMWNSIAMAAINAIEQIALKWVEKHVLMAAYNAIFHTQQTAQQVAAAAAQTAAHSAANVTQATSDAGLAAAGTFAWYSAVFPPIAPAMALAAYGEGMGFAGLAAFHGGGIAGEEQLAVLKRNEMVLDPVLSSGFQKMLGSGGTPGRDGAAGPSGDGGGGSSYVGPTNKYGDIHISAFDAKGVADMIHRNQPAFTKAAAAIARNGWRPR